MAPRRYDSSRRRALAETTRTQILEAMHALVGGKGDLQDLSMEAVAKRAGVSRMTVYYQFHSRAELLEALADHLAGRGGMERMREVFLEPDPDRALRKLVETFAGFWASDRVTLRRIRALGVIYPGATAGPRDRDTWRQEAIRNLLSRRGARRGGGNGPSAEVVDTLAMLTSFETFDSLSHGNRSAAAVAKLLGDLAIAVVRGAG